MQPLTVLIVGQLRNRHVLMRSVGVLQRLRAEGLVDRVILATWTEELRKAEAIVPWLRAAGVEILAVDEPDAQWAGPGNLMYQMRGVDLALERVEDTAWVLRARPDLVIDEGLIRGLAAADMSLAPADEGGPFAHKIWTPLVEACQPMCLSDITYFGRYPDIVRLQTFDLFHEIARAHAVLHPNGKPLTSYDAEVRRFTPAFVGGYPVLGEYFRLYSHFLLGIFELRRAMLNALYRQELYWQYMAAYFDVLERYVLIGRDVLETPLLLARPESYDQANEVGCLNLMRCDYVAEALGAPADPPATVEAFSKAPIYCTHSAGVRAVAERLNAIGADLPRRLDGARAYRKDASRIAAVASFRAALVGAINTGVEMGRPKIEAWRHPFETKFLDFAQAPPTGR